jgi:hypothetical protein
MRAGSALAETDMPFIQVGKRVINTDHIVEFHEIGEGKVVFAMSVGQSLTVSGTAEEVSNAIARADVNVVRVRASSEDSAEWRRAQSGAGSRGQDPALLDHGL